MFDDAEHRPGSTRMVATLAAVCALTAVTGGCATSSGNSTAPAFSPPQVKTITSATPSAASAVPRADHVVIVVEENHAYSDIIGRPQAPYVNSLARQGALFTQSYAITHPSEPNYLALLSGSTQGITDDSCPHTFTTENLGQQLVTAGLSFAGYSEGLPSTDSLDCSTGNYDRNHNPWVNFANIPASANMAFSAFPTDFSTLPTVSFVIPNLLDDMHDGTISQADTWLRTNLGSYAQWAKTHNSLLIVTADEDDNSSDNQVATIFVGAHVKPGIYPEKINHYSVLRTVESAYGLTPLGSATNTPPITDVWYGR